MGVVKCVSCGTYIDASEVVLVPVDDTHDASYCVSCAPEDSYNSLESDED